MPDAPTPTYDTDGNLALGWLLVVRYDPPTNVVTLSWSKDGDLYRSSKHGAVAYQAHEVEDITEAARATVVMLTSPSLL